MDLVTAPTPPDPTLHQLIDELADDLMRLSDVELIAEAREQGNDPETVAAEMRACIQAAVASVGKARLIEARAAIQRDRATSVKVRSVVRVSNRYAVLARISGNDVGLKSRLTMAARAGAAMTDEEADSILQDLLELGVIDEEGNPI